VNRSSDFHSPSILSVRARIHNRTCVHVTNISTSVISPLTSVFDEESIPNEGGYEILFLPIFCTMYKLFYKWNCTFFPKVFFCFQKLFSMLWRAHEDIDYTACITKSFIRRCPYCFTELLGSYALSIMVKNAIIRECIFDRKSRLWQNCNKCQFLLRMTIASDSIRIETQIAIWVLRRNFKSRQSKEERLRYIQKNIQRDDKNVRDNMCKTSLKMLDII